jgi:hypothetical protein
MKSPTVYTYSIIQFSSKYAIRREAEDATEDYFYDLTEDRPSKDDDQGWVTLDDIEKALTLDPCVLFPVLDRLRATIVEVDEYQLRYICMSVE